MPSEKTKKVWLIITGFCAGLINSLLGTGGGIAAVTLLGKTGLSKKECHATSIGVILPLSLCSTVLYLYRGSFTLGQALPFLPAGLIGAAAGAFLLKRIPKRWLRLLFGGIAIYSAFRLFGR